MWISTWSYYLQNLRHPYPLTGQIKIITNWDITPLIWKDYQMNINLPWRDVIYLLSILSCHHWGQMCTSWLYVPSEPLKPLSFKSLFLCSFLPIFIMILNELYSALKSYLYSPRNGKKQINKTNKNVHSKHSIIINIYI